MFYKKTVLSLFIALTIGLARANNFDDITRIQSNSESEIYELTISGFEALTSSGEGQELGQRVIFNNAYFLETSAIYDLPVRILNFAIPKNGSLNIQLLSKSDKIIRSVNLKEKEDFELTDRNLDQLISLGEKKRFRDMMVQEVIINPLAYNKSAHSLKLTHKIKFKVSYHGQAASSGTFKKRGQLDELYKNLLVNFEKGRDWQIPKRRRIFKSQTLGSGTYYGFDVTKNGLYKITPASLSNSGINNSAISINALQLFNNGGHTLTVATTANQWNPSSTEEVAILAFDLNNNGLFDGNDYLLFYGKALNGWFYNTSKKKFVHQTHPYDTKNRYYLTINGSNGKRMVSAPLATINGATDQSYFIERFHFEEDKVNLLSSGPTWYGQRFFGNSASDNIDFNLDVDLGSNVKPIFKISLKGGSNIFWPENYETRRDYKFNLKLNDIAIFNENDLEFKGSSTLTKSVNLSSVSVLKSGENRLQLNFLSSFDDAKAYLDYFNISFPRKLSAVNDNISFYHDDSNSDKRYSISGLSNRNDFIVLDITDPVNIIVLGEKLSAQNGQLNIDIPREWESKNVLVSSLASSEVQSINTLLVYEPQTNLLSTSNSADYIIITRKSLTDYGTQIAELRNHLQTKVISVDDIFFYFNSGVQDPVAIRNFIRYAYYNWQTPTLSYVLLFGDGHYDFRNISIKDSSLVPTFQIGGADDLASRTSDMFYAQLESNGSLSLITPSVAIGRIPVENALDAERMLEKLTQYKQNNIKDGWQTVLTFAGDDEKTSNSESEFIHQRQTEALATLFELKRFNKSRIYISAYEEVPGGRGRLVPEATKDLLDQINRGSLIVNYTGHGSPTQWAHETLFSFDRDYSKINNENKYTFIVAATCDFGIFDNPNHTSFTEALIWKEKSGTIGSLAATRLVYSSDNFKFNKDFYKFLFPGGGSSISLGDAFISALNVNGGAGRNDQKYHLLADPTMLLADGREEIEVTSILPDTLKALSIVKIKAKIKVARNFTKNYNGGAVILVNDAKFEDINTWTENDGGGGGTNPIYNYDLQGPLIFRGEVSVTDGNIEGEFIVPKSIRYKNKRTGRLTLYAWDESTNLTAQTYKNDLLFLGSSSLATENDGPGIDIFFDNQENFSSGDIIQENPILVAELIDKSGINLTGQLGHKIELRIDNTKAVDISESFTYNRDSFTKGLIHYPLTDLEPGAHTLSLQVFDNLNNRSEKSVEFRISDSDGLVLEEVVNYPNPFRKQTRFTFQTNRDGAEAQVKIYTVSGRLIEKLEGYFTKAGYNEIEWNGLDRDGNTLANGLYLYKIILKEGKDKKEKIEKMIVVK